MKKQFEVTVKLDPFFSYSKPIPIMFKYSKFGYEDKDYIKDLYITVGKKYDNNIEIAPVFNFYMKDSEKKKEEQQKEKIDKLKPCFQIKNWINSAKKT